MEEDRAHYNEKVDQPRLCRHTMTRLEAILSSLQAPISKNNATYKMPFLHLLVALLFREDGSSVATLRSDLLEELHVPFSPCDPGFA